MEENKLSIINSKLSITRTPDYNQERLDTIKKIYPDLFTLEGKLDINELKKLEDPENVNEVERYEFRWFGKSKAKREAFMPTDATLIYDEGKSVNPNNSENLIIEGENLNVLKLLSSGYRNKIKCIYIDPPYNTGKDFVYRDNYKKDKAEYWEETGITENGIKIDTNTDASGRYHSNWLNMMYSRLLIARQLMREDGVMFISIDDNEVHHLRKLCDIVFGEENFVGQIIWQTATDNNPTQIATEHEYVICYVKNTEEQKFWEISSEKGKFIQEKYEELKNKYNKDIDEIQSNLRKWIRKQTNGDDLSGVSHYSYVDEIGVFYPGNSANTKQGGYTYDILHPITKKVCAKPDYGYRFTKETFDNADNRGDVFWGDNENTIPKIKKRLDTVMQKLKSYYYEDNRATTKQLKDLMDNKKIFNNPKSINFLKHIFKFVVSKNDVVFDFFGGSGSTAQAIMELNQEDGGNRQCILVQIPEATDPKSEAYKAGYKRISDITIERNKRVVEKLIAEKKGKQPDLFTEKESEKEQLKGLGFKVFRLTKSQFPRTEWRPEIDKTDEENIQAFKDYVKVKELQLTQTLNINDLLIEILIKRGFELTFTIEEQPQFIQNKIQLIKDSEKTAYICLDAELKEETVEYFKTNTDTKFICLERALNTTKKWNLKHYMKEKIDAF